MDISRSRAVGALVGLAVCDALGTTVEFKERDTFAPLTDMVGGGPFELAPGQWTDDTSMALCLAESLIQTRSFDLHDQSARYIKWVDEGYFSSTGQCFDIGQQTVTALYFFRRTGKVSDGFCNIRQAGNGSLMRLAPVPIAFCGDVEKAARFGAASSLTTHIAAVCGEACAAYSRLIALAIQGVGKEALFVECGRLAEKVEHPELKAILAGSFLTKTRNDISSSGYIIHTLEAALWAFARADSFADGALLAVNLGDDADTVGAVYGQLAGAFYGVDAIPAHWREVLYQGEMIAQMAGELCDLAGSVEVAEESREIVELLLLGNGFVETNH